MTQTANNTIDKQRIAKNTLLLYLRMFFLLLVGFYTVRLLLEYLGVEDYGLYNVIFGLVTAFSFFSNAISLTVKRFICYEIGSGCLENACKVFLLSIYLFCALSLIVLVLAETIGLWFVCNKMNIPSERFTTAQVVYQISIFMIIFKILQIPYTAVITSYENMRTFAQISILDAFLHLLSVLALKFILYDRLICFAALYTLANLITLACYFIYCRKKYAICRCGLNPNRQYLKPMLSFFSWNLFGSTANIFKHQGLNLLLNVFYGVVLNATWGIANQVSGAVSQFAVGFQQAFSPQILKSYSAPDKQPFLDLISSSSRYSFLLIWFVGLPIILQTDFLLKIWLGAKVPAEAAIFTQLLVATIVVDAVCTPLWMAVQATGKNKKYEIVCSVFIFSILPISFFLLKFGAPSYSVPLTNLIIFTVAIIYRLYYLKTEIDFSVKKYCQKTLVPAVIIICITLCGGEYLKLFFTDSTLACVLCLLIIIPLNLLFSFSFGLSSQEKKQLIAYLQRKLTHE